MDEKRLIERPNDKVRLSIEELTLVLLYLNRFPWARGDEARFAWKGYDFDALRHLAKKDFIYLGRSFRNKSVMLTDEGTSEALRLLKKYDLSDWQ